MPEEEFELIPVSPLRRLEKRIDKLESTSGEDPKGIFKDILEIVKMNQQIVDELAKSNDALRIELSKLPSKLDELVTEIRELITFIKTAGEEEVTGTTQESMKPVVDRLEELVKVSKTVSEKNDSMLTLLDEIEKKLRAARPVRPLLHSPLPPAPFKPFKRLELKV